jgi:hypothetical protein
VTVVRYGPRLTARVRFDEREWEDCEPRDLVTYVSEEHNPGNEKGVTGVEMFVPSPLLASGMCLVDTPGVGSCRRPVLQPPASSLPMSMSRSWYSARILQFHEKK